MTLAEDADTVITITVTSINGDSTRTYTVTVTRQAATDTTSPSVDSAAVSEDGTKIEIVFDEALDRSGTAPAVSVFDVTVDGGTAVNPTSVDFHATNADTVVLAMSPAIAAGGTVTVAYDKPTSNALADAASNEVESFTGTDAIAAPNRPAAPVVTLTPASGKLTATWAAPTNGGDAITGYDVEWKTAAQTWAEAATAGQSATAAADATGHEISGLTNGIEHTVRVRAGNDAGDGPWSAEASETPVAASSDADLSGLTVDGTGVTDFAADTTEYTVTVDRATTQVTVAGTASDTNAGVEIAPADADTGTSATGHQVDLEGGKTAVTVTVTAEDGTTTKDYTVNFHRPVVPHDWSLRPEGVPTGETFRVLIVTSTRRTGTTNDIDHYDRHVRSALAGGHMDIEEYGPLFKALAATQGGAAPRSHTGTDPDDDGPGEEIWWLNGPRAADDYADFYDGDWDHSNPARTESGNERTFEAFSDYDRARHALVWTGTDSEGEPHERLGGGNPSTGGPASMTQVWDQGNDPLASNDLSLYGLSAVMYIEPPDVPYATVAAITSVPDDGANYEAGETITATVTFSEEVAVSGTPRLPLRIGDEVRDAAYQSISTDGLVLSFSYTVQDGDQDLDGVSVDKSSLELNGATITGIVGGASEGETAALTHTGVVADADQSVNSHLAVAVPHDWSLRPEGVATGEQFRLLIVTSTERHAESGDIADYDAHVRSAVAIGHDDIRDYAGQFQALAATEGGAAPKSHTGTDTDDDTSVEIWWLNGPRAADDYGDFYDGSWDHSNPARTESGGRKTFIDPGASGSLDRRAVWTGTRVNGTPSSSSTLGHPDGGSAIGSPYTGRVWRVQGSNILDQEFSLGLYGLSGVFHIEAPDAPYATVAAITSEPSDTFSYQTGETITVTVTFSEAVAVATADGSPRLPLGIGSNTRNAGYESIDSTGMVLTFSYEVVDGDVDLDGFTVEGFSLELNGGSITGTTGDHNGVAAALTHTGVAADENRKVNAPPLITGVEVTSSPKADPDNDTYGLGEDIEITVTFSEAVNVTGDAVEGDVEFGLSVGGAVRARLKSGNGTTELVFAYTVQAGDTDTNGIWIGHPDHDDNPTFDLQSGQSVVGVDSGRDALLEHDEVGTQGDHKVDGSLTAADATLSSLTLTGITLVPAFAAGTTAYAATTSLSSTTVTATATQSGGSSAVAITPADADTNTTDHDVNLDVGDTVITVTVTSTNGNSVRTYTVTVTRQAATDSTAPSVDSATVSTDGTTVDITFDEDLDTDLTLPANTQFTVAVAGTNKTPETVAFHASDANTITLTMATADAIAAGATVTVAYDKPTSNALADAASNEVESFTGTDAISAPNRPAAPAVTLTPASGQITATWAAPANGGSEITGYDVEWKTAAQTWAEAATAGQSDTAAADATDHEITGLTNSTEYTVRVRAANDAGDGPWSTEASETPVAASADAELSDLTVDDGTGAASVDGFDPADTRYTVTVDRDTTQVTVAATASDTNAGVEITPADADTSTSATGNQVDLEGGKTAVTVTVTAEDGTTTKAYTVNFHRPVVPHDWSLRPEGVPTGESFRVLIVTSTTRNAESGDIADYDAHVRSALANRGHADIRDYGPLFKALAATLGGAHPRSHTDTHPDDDGPGEQIWWLNGPRVADNYADFYDGTWDHSNPARTESGAPKTFDPPSAADSDQVVWTGTRVNGTRSGSRHLGTTQTNSAGRFVASVGSPQSGEMWFTSNVSIDFDGLGLYGLSGVFYIEEPDAPYATVAAITTEPANGSSFVTGEEIVATVTFSEAVTVSGSPRLPLRIGSNTRNAGYESLSSDGMVLTFSYEVVDGDVDLDGFTVEGFSLELNGGSITGTTGDHNGVAAALTHTGVAADENRKVNAPPLITGVEVTSSPKADPDNDTYGLGEDIEITVTFSEAVNVTGDAVEGDVEFGLSVGGAVRARLKSGNGTTELVFAYTVQAGDTDTNGIWIGHPDHDDNPTFDLQSGQSVVGVDSGRDALLEHDEVGTQGDHKVDGSLTAADATLSSLTLTGITLVPAFAAGTTAYAATTSLSSTTVTIAISQGQNGATGRITAPNDADLSESGHQVTLAEDADTVITITVTSINGDSTRTYTVTVTRMDDTSAPRQSSAQVSTDGTAIHIVFDEDLDTDGSPPPATAFEVTVDGGTAVNPRGVAFHSTRANTIVLTMEMSDTIAVGATVSVTYLKPTTNALTDSDGSEVAAFSGQEAARRGTTSAQVSADGTAVDITFGEDLDSSGTAPAASAFTVTVGTATGVSPDSVAFHASDADTITLTMATADAIAAGAAVSVAYEKPTSNALAYATSNEVESFTGTDAIAATNRPAAPVVTLTAGNEKLTAVWAAPANGGSAITGYDVEWKTAAQTWAEAATAGQSDTAGADAATHDITGLTNDTEYTVRVRAGNDAGDGPWSAEASETPIAGDTTVPAPDSATVSTDGTTIDIVFDEDLDSTGSAPAADAFDVSVDGGTAVNPTRVDFHATDADTVVLTMKPAIAAGAAVSVAYDKPTSNALADAASNEVVDFTQTALNRPAAPVVTLTAGNGKLTATWTAPANGGSAITGYDVEWKTAAQTWAEAATAGGSPPPAMSGLPTPPAMSADHRPDQ